ncbi:MAG: protein kinase, partial [Romboutsia sp.]|nr:protein kinase [Romboutsia sp.]
DILCFIDFEKSKDHWWLITEYIDNPSLVEFLETKLNQKDKLTLMINIAKAIQRLHSVNIIHKDIKQENILVDPKTLKIKLIDFGYSCILNEEICKTAMGTIEYIDARLLFSHLSGKYNDIYSLGVLFAEMWTNHFIVAKDDIQKVRKRDAVLQLNREINKIKDNKIKTLIQNMTQRDTSLRPDINQVLSELNDI